MACKIVVYKDLGAKPDKQFQAHVQGHPDSVKCAETAEKAVVEVIKSSGSLTQMSLEGV